MIGQSDNRPKKFPLLETLYQSILKRFVSFKSKPLKKPGLEN